MNLEQKLESINACGEALEWVGERNDLDQLWAECDRGDWMAWLISNVANGPVNSDAHRKTARVKAEIALEVIDIYEAKYPKDTRPREAIEEMLAYAGGDDYAVVAVPIAAAYSTADSDVFATAHWASVAINAAITITASAASVANHSIATASIAASYAAAAGSVSTAVKAACGMMSAKIADIIRKHYTAKEISEALVL